MRFVNTRFGAEDSKISTSPAPSRTVDNKLYVSNPSLSERNLTHSLSQTSQDALVNSISLKQSSNIGRFRAAAKPSFDDHYILGQEIGRGAFSKVFECTCRETRQRYAVKCIDSRKLLPRDLASLQREISISSAIVHPGVCAVVDLFEDQTSGTKIVQELASAGDLFQRIQNRTCLSERTSAIIMARLLQTVAYIHIRGIVHRDIKPENILCAKSDDDTDVRLTDFGFAKRTSDIVCDEACGTPQYVAPEIILGEEYGTKVDIWSLGVVCYAMLAGYAPFHSQSTVTLFNSIVHADYQFHSKFWGHVSMEAKNFIRCMLKVNPSERWSAHKLLSHPWIVSHAGNELNTGLAAELNKIDLSVPPAEIQIPRLPLASSSQVPPRDRKRQLISRMKWLRAMLATKLCSRRPPTVKEPSVSFS